MAFSKQDVQKTVRMIARDEVSCEESFTFPGGVLYVWKASSQLPIKRICVVAYEGGIIQCDQDICAFEKGLKQLRPVLSNVDFLMQALKKCLPPLRLPIFGISQHFAKVKEAIDKPKYEDGVLTFFVENLTDGIIERFCIASDYSVVVFKLAEGQKFSRL